MPSDRPPPLRRKLLAAREAGPEALRATLRLAIGRAGRVCPGGEIEAGDIAVSQTGLEAMLAGLPAEGVSLLLSTPGSEWPSGLAHLTPGLLDAVVEQVVTGRVRARPVPAAQAGLPAGAGRSPTALDILLAGDFLHALLAEMGQSPGLAALVRGIVPGGPAPLAQTLRYRMQAGPYRAMQCEIGLGPGVGGVLRLWLRDQHAAPDRPGVAGDPPQPADAAHWSDRLAAAVGQASMPLVAVLHREVMELRALRMLQPGMRIALPAGAATAVRLVAAGHDLGLAGRLGRARGRRAVQIGGPPAAALDAPRARLPDEQAPAASGG